MWSLSLSLSFSHFYLFYFLSKSTNASFHLLNLDVFFGVSQVLGNAKGAVAVVVSILIFRNPVSVTGMLGYSLTVFWRHPLQWGKEAKQMTNYRGNTNSVSVFLYARTGANLLEASIGRPCSQLVSLDFAPSQFYFFPWKPWVTGFHLYQQQPPE